jgi:hypothetical protein
LGDAFAAFCEPAGSGTIPRLYDQLQWTDILHGPAGKAGSDIAFRMARDGGLAFHQVIMWYITDSEACRLNALKIIRTGLTLGSR